VEAAKVYFDARGDVMLRDAETYLLRNRRFYQMLSAGEFGPLDEMPLPVLEEAKKAYKGIQRHTKAILFTCAIQLQPKEWKISRCQKNYV
jgi:hypothetical protein